MALRFSAGQIITADALNASVPLYAVKSALQTIASSTVLQNDAALFLDLAAGRTYEVSVFLAFSGNSAGDIKVAYATTGSVFLAAQRTCHGPQLATTDRLATSVVLVGAQAIGTAQPYGCDPSGNISYIEEQMIVQCSIAGRLTLQWAQNTSFATSTNIWNTSWMRARPVD